MFLEQFLVHSKIERKVQKFATDPFPHTCVAFPLVSITHRSGMGFLPRVDLP